jgi:hypothetical protein
LGIAMTTGLLFILALGALIGGWTVLSLFGEERSRRLNDLEARRRAAAATIPLLRVPSSPNFDSARKPARKSRPTPPKSSDKGK